MSAAVSFRVFRNQEGQYACVRPSWPVAAGWVDTGFTGSPQECESYVEQHWLDLRPASVREAGRDTVQGGTR